MKPGTLAVCVAPIQSKFNNVLQLVEFIELWKLLGADHFYFYVLSAASDVRRVLKYYKKSGTVTIMNWNLRGLFNVLQLKL